MIDRLRPVPDLRYRVALLHLWQAALVVLFVLRWQ